MKSFVHLVASLAALAVVCAGAKATAEPHHDADRRRAGHAQCGELSFEHGRLRLNPERCRGHRGWRARDDRHWGADAVLFEHSGFRGENLPLRYDIPDLAEFDFDDRASSILIVRGRWEGCTEPDYRGRCWRVSDDQDGFFAPANNRIRSIRRVR